MPPRSVLSSARCTPTAPNAVSMRWIMLAFSAVGNTEACVTRRRMSRPESGFATTPTIASPKAPTSSPHFARLTSKREYLYAGTGAGGHRRVRWEGLSPPPLAGEPPRQVAGPSPVESGTRAPVDLGLRLDDAGLGGRLQSAKGIGEAGRRRLRLRRTVRP